MFALPGPRRVRSSVAFPWFFGNCWWSPQYLVIPRGKSLVAFQIEPNAAEEVRQILDSVWGEGISRSIDHCGKLGA
jgi:hypothetical protein